VSEPYSAKAFTITNCGIGSTVTPFVGVANQPITFTDGGGNIGYLLPVGLTDGIPSSGLGTGAKTAGYVATNPVVAGVVQPGLGINTNPYDGLAFNGALIEAAQIYPASSYTLDTQYHRDHWVLMTAGALSGSINGATNANPTVISTTAAHNLTTGDIVTIASVGGNTGANGTNLSVTVIDTTHFSIPVNTVGGGAYTSGGTFTRTGVSLFIPNANVRPGRKIIVIDYSQSFGTRSLLIIPTGGTVAGASTLTLNTNLDNVELVADASSNWMVFKKAFGP
jgi:hypothetical protein